MRLPYWKLYLAINPRTGAVIAGSAELLNFLRASVDDRWDFTAPLPVVAYVAGDPGEAHLLTPGAELAQVLDDGVDPDTGERTGPVRARDVTLVGPHPVVFGDMVVRVDATGKLARADADLLLPRDEGVLDRTLSVRQVRDILLANADLSPADREAIRKAVVAEAS